MNYTVGFHGIEEGAVEPDRAHHVGQRIGTLEVPARPSLDTRLTTVDARSFTRHWTLGTVTSDEEDMRTAPSRLLHPGGVPTTRQELTARRRDIADVIVGVPFAREHRLLLAVRGVDPTNLFRVDQNLKPV